jgi:glucosyl-3-phosphoglycerate phosphatase
MSDLRVVIWRHGQTDWNIQSRFQGHSDIPLNKVGEYQANHAAKILAGMKPVRIIASDLIRAQQTAAPLLALTKIKLEIDSQLRETNGGNWEGKTEDENFAADPENFRAWLTGKDVKAGAIGESRKDVALRARAAFDRATRDATGTLIFVTHGGTTRCLLGSLLNLPFDNWAALGGLSNACWSVLEPKEQSWTLVEHNAGSIPEPVFGTETSS